MFYDYVLRCEAFYQREHYFFDNSPYLDGLMGLRCIFSGLTRIQQPDYDGFLEIGRDFEFHAALAEDPMPFLKSHGIDRPFITFHRGNDVAYGGDAVKLWPLESYSSLIRMMKEKYPGYLMVQIGVSRERCPPMDGIDIDLVGQTSMENVKGIMKYASLHVDSEGGFVHLRRSLMGGQSVVFFGPTSLDYYAYEGNINISGTGCNIPCEWITKDWISSCARGFAHPPCMTSISPEDVMDRIVSEWKGARE